MSVYTVRFYVEYPVEAQNEDKAYQEAKERFREDWESMQFGISEMFSDYIEKTE